MSRLPLLAFFLATASFNPLAAQRLSDGFARWEYPAGDSAAGGTDPGPSSHRDESPRRDYRYEGLMIGGAGLGTFGAILGHGLKGACPTVPGAECDGGGLGDAITLGLIGAAIGGGAGYLIGRLSPKPPPRSGIDSAAFPSAVSPQRDAIAVPDSVRQKVGYQHWKGGAIGVAVGGFAGLLLSQTMDGECYDCTSDDSVTLKAGLLGAGLGGAFGFLVGAASPKYRWVSPGR